MDFKERYKKIEFNNKCECQFDPVWLAKSLIWFNRYAVIKKPINIFLNSDGYPVVYYSKKVRKVHRLIAMYKACEILPIDVHIHHIDENKLNANVWNLEIKSSSSHIKEHWDTNGKRIKIDLNEVRKIIDSGATLTETSKILNHNLITLRCQILKYTDINYIIPRIEIDLNKAKSLIESGYPVASVAKILGVNYCQLRNRIRTSNIKIKYVHHTKRTA